jgi:hypothetical protein
MGHKMQLANAPNAEAFPNVANAIQPERLDRYLPAAGKDKEKAFAYYLWNCALCESFHFSLHFAEIVCRNTLNRALVQRCGKKWYKDALFIKILDQRYAAELDQVEEQETQQHGTKVTCHHICSALTFGFWEHVATKRFERFLWAKGVKAVFPNAPKDMTRHDVQVLIESVRKWRNRIAHHRAIFDKKPMRKHSDTLSLISLTCGQTSAWVASVSRVPVAINLRPN